MEPLARYREMLETSGVQVDVQEDLTAVTRPTFARWRANAAEHSDEVIGLIGADDYAQFVRSCDVLEKFWDDGTLGYGLIAGCRI